MFLKLCPYFFLFMVLSSQENEFQKFLKKRILEGERLNINYSSDSQVCTQCKEATSSIQTLDLTQFTVWFRAQFDTNCNQFLQQDVCQKMTQTYLNQFSKHLFKLIPNPELLCARLGACENTKASLKLSDYIDNVMKVRLSEQEIEWKTVAQSKSTANTNYRILQLTDLHVDFQYLQGANTYCNDEICCRQQNGIASESYYGAKLWGSYSICDIPIHTVDNMLTFIAQNINPDVIIWNGDTISHDKQHQQQNTQSLPQLQITKKIVAALPNAKLYPIFGNQETYPTDQYDIYGADSQWLNNESADMWQNSLSATAIASLRSNGYYSELNSALNARFIALNTQACNCLNFYLLDEAADPNQHLEWLKEQLKEAETNHQFVFLFGHIPPGDKYCVSSWARRFNVLTDRYKHLIKGLFYGHSHDDQIEHIISEVDSSVLHTIYIAPSVTTNSYQNPAFRVYHVEGTTNKIIDYSQYRMDMEAANKAGASATNVWFLQYNFKEQYGLKSMEPAETYRLTTLIREDNPILWSQKSTSRRDNVKIISSNINLKRDRDNFIYDERFQDFFVCRINNAVFDDFFKCIKPPHIDGAYIYKYLQELSVEGLKYTKSFNGIFLYTSALTLLMII